MKVLDLTRLEAYTVDLDKLARRMTGLDTSESLPRDNSARARRLGSGGSCPCSACRGPRS